MTIVSIRRRTGPWTATLIWALIVSLVPAQGFAWRVPAAQASPVQAGTQGTAQPDVRSLPSAQRLAGMPDWMPFQAADDPLETTISMSHVAQNAAVEAGFSPFADDVVVDDAGTSVTLTYSDADGDVTITARLSEDGSGIEIVKELRPVTASGGVGTPVRITGTGRASSTPSPDLGGLVQHVAPPGSPTELRLPGGARIRVWPLPSSVGRQFGQQIFDHYAAQVERLAGPRDAHGELLGPNASSTVGSIVDFLTGARGMDGEGVVARNTAIALLMARDAVLQDVENLITHLGQTWRRPPGEKQQLGDTLRGPAATLLQAQKDLEAAKRGIEAYQPSELFYQNAIRRAEELEQAGEREAAADMRKQAEDSFYGRYLAARARYVSLLDESPLLALRYDGQFLYEVLGDPARSPRTDAAMLDVIDNFLLSGIVAAEAQAKEIRAMNTVKDLSQFASSRYAGVHQRLADMGERGGTRIVTDLMSELQAAANGSLKSWSEEAWNKIDTLAFIVVGIGSMFLPFGPLLALGISAIQVIRAADETYVAYLEHQDAMAMASLGRSTGGGAQVVATLDNLETKQHELFVSVALGTLDVYGATTYARIVRAERARAAGTEAIRASAAARAEVRAPLDRLTEQALVHARRFGGSENQVRELTKLARAGGREGDNAYGILEHLASVDDAVRLASADGVPAHVIEGVLQRAAKGSAGQPLWQAAAFGSDGVKRELAVLRMQARDLTIVVDNAERELFREFAGAVQPRSVVHVGSDELARFEWKVTQAAAGRLNTGFTPREEQIGRWLSSHRDRLSRWWEYESTEHGFIKLFDDGFPAALDKIFPRGALAPGIPRTTAAPRPIMPRTAGADDVGTHIERAADRRRTQLMNPADPPLIDPSATRAIDPGTPPLRPPDDIPTNLFPGRSREPGAGTGAGSGSRADSGGRAAGGAAAAAVAVAATATPAEAGIGTAPVPASEAHRRAERIARRVGVVELRDMESIALLAGEPPVLHIGGQPWYAGGLSGERAPQLNGGHLAQFLAMSGALQQVPRDARVQYEIVDIGEQTAESILDEIDPVLVIADSTRLHDRRVVARARPSIQGWLSRTFTRLFMRPAFFAASGAPLHGSQAPPVRARQPGQASSSASLPPLQLLLTGTGESSGIAFQMEALNTSGRPVRIEKMTLVVEPVHADAASRVRRELEQFRTHKPTAIPAAGYCLEHYREPPAAGTLFRIAPPEVQQRFNHARRILEAAGLLQRAGVLQPDSNARSYFHWIRQWALWTKEEGFSLDAFKNAFLDQTRKNVIAAGQAWTPQIEAAVVGAVPHRWQEIQQILEVAQLLDEARAD